ncbi:MAG: helix-turn-helix domain-containing protein [Mesorhizobium sp.]|nr:MAG: helix-turn-helix domain-containing protein [Mesorhizobium sp.]
MQTMRISATIPEAVEMTGLSRSALYRLFNEGKITPRKNRKRTLILVEDLRRYVENLPIAS